jgi:hypothetical protein
MDHAPVQIERHAMSQFKAAASRHRLAALAVAVAVSGSLLSSVLLVFADAGRTPCFAPTSQYADAAAACARSTAVKKRDRCLRALAEVAKLGASAPTLLASH